MAKDAKGHGSDGRGLPGGWLANRLASQLTGQSSAVQNRLAAESLAGDHPKSSPPSTGYGQRTPMLNPRSEFANQSGSVSRRAIARGAPGGSWNSQEVADRFKGYAREARGFASAKREINQLQRRGK